MKTLYTYHARYPRVGASSAFEHRAQQTPDQAWAEAADWGFRKGWGAPAAVVETIAVSADLPDLAAGTRPPFTLSAERWQALPPDLVWEAAGSKFVRMNPTDGPGPYWWPVVVQQEDETK